MQFDVITLFPEMFSALTGSGITRRAFEEKRCSLTLWNPRDFTHDRHRTVDDRPYGLTKAAMNSLVQGLAYRFVSEGYRINAIAPGVTASDMTGVKVDENLYCYNKVTNRYYLPEEVAEIACFLLSDISNALNGQILVCNEGKTINARWK